MKKIEVEISVNFSFFLLLLMIPTVVTIVVLVARKENICVRNLEKIESNRNYRDSREG